MNFKGLRFKLIAIVALSLLLLLAVQFTASQSLLLQGYNKLESEKTYIQISNAKKMVAQQGQQLEGLSKDWAHSDDSYDYMVTHKQAYIDSNFNKEVFSKLKINAIFITNNQGQIIYQSAYDFANDKPWSIPPKLNLAVSNNGVYVRPTKAGYITGLLWSPVGLMMVSAVDILPIHAKGSRRGVLIMMRLIDPLLLQQIETIVGAKISIMDLSDPNKLADNIKLVGQKIASPNGWAMQTLNKNEVAAYAKLQSVYPGHDLLLKIVCDRKILELGKGSASLIFWSIGSIVLILLILSVLFDKLLIARLAKLSRSVSLINESTDSAARLPAIGGSDEISNLAHCINSMLASLDDQQKALKESEFLWRFAIEGAGDSVWDWNIQTGEMQYSTLWKKMFGYSEEDILPSYDEWVSRIDPKDQAYVAMIKQDYLEGKTDVFVAEYRVRCKYNQCKWILSRGMMLSRSDEGKPSRMLGTHTDITDRKLAEAELKIAAIAFESQEGMMITDADTVILRVNRAFTLITGYTAKEAVGKTPQLISSGQHDDAFYAAMWESLNNKYVWEGEVWNRRKNGEAHPEHVTITVVRDDNGIVTNYVATLTDITVRKAAEEEVMRLAFYDSLTGLPNRRLLFDRLKRASIYCARSGRACAILFLDLDYFKALNDTLGHDIGDLLLQQVAFRLESCVREGDTVARLGGDEFVIMLENLSEQALDAAKQTEEIGKKILAILNQPYQLAHHQYHSTPSIGAVLINNQNQAPAQILKQADIAMYQAKKDGRNRLRFFDPQIEAYLVERHLTTSLPKLLIKNT